MYSAKPPSMVTPRALKFSQRSDCPRLVLCSKGFPGGAETECVPAVEAVVAGEADVGRCAVAELKALDVLSHLDHLSDRFVARDQLPPRNNAH